MKTIKVLFFALVFLSFINSYSQPYNPFAGMGGINCQEVEPLTQNKNLISPGGFLKPERTDANSYPNTTDESVFRILIVFVQYYGDNSYANNSDWPAQQPPSYIYSLLAPNRHNNHVDLPPIFSTHRRA